MNSDLGILDPIADLGQGRYRCILRNTVGGTAEVRVSYQDPEGRFAPFNQTIRISFPCNFHPPQPGINPGVFKDAGRIDGYLRVFTVYADSAGRTDDQPPVAFKNAFIMVEKGAERHIGYTGSCGAWAIYDADLKGPVTVTIGAEGYRYVTLFGLNGENISIPMQQLDPMPGPDGERVGSIEGRVYGFDGEGGLEPLPESSNLLST